MFSETKFGIPRLSSAYFLLPYPSSSFRTDSSRSRYGENMCCCCRLIGHWPLDAVRRIIHSIMSKKPLELVNEKRSSLLGVNVKESRKRFMAGLNLHRADMFSPLRPMVVEKASRRKVGIRVGGPEGVRLACLSPLRRWQVELLVEARG